MTDADIESVDTVNCSNCAEEVEAARDKDGRVVGVIGGGGGGGAASYFLGKSRGVVGNGTGTNAAIPYMFAGGLIGGLVSYIVADKYVDKPYCPNCGEDLNLNT